MNKRALITLSTCLCFTSVVWAQSTGSTPPAAGQQPRPGTTTGQGMGPGMMGGQGMGPGMMGGQGMGPGMMGGHAMGPGMGGFGLGSWGANLSDLTAEQRSKISDIQKEFHQKQWTLMEQMHKGFQPGNFYRSGTLDEQAARRTYEAMNSLHKQMFENALAAQKRIDSILTPQQREQLQRAAAGGR